MPNNSRVLTVGIDSMATDSIDEFLEEYWIHCPFASGNNSDCVPYDHFEVVIDLPNPPFLFRGTWKDFRNGDVPYSGTKTHKIICMAYSTATALYISWDFPIGVTGLLQDIFGGVILNYQMPDSGTFTDPSLLQLGGFGINLILTYQNAGGDPAGPLFGMSPTSLNFPPNIIGTTDSLPVTISNYGNLNTLVINDIQLSNNHFLISPNTTPLNILPESSQTFYVTRTVDSTAEEGTISFLHNAPGTPAVLNVSSPPGLQVGTVMYSLYPASLYFDYPTKSSSFENDKTDSLIITDINSTNSNFTFTPNILPIIIPPGSEKLFHITLNNSGQQFGVINFNHSFGTTYLPVSNYKLEPHIKGLLLIESGSASHPLWFGVDSWGTDGIDQILDENDIPPPPPLTVFDTRFVLPKNNFSGIWNSYNDFRSGNPTFAGQKEYRLYYQQYLNNPIKINWYLPEGVTGVLQDIITGTLINVPIADTGSFIVTDPIAFDRLKMLIDFDLQTPVELTSFTASLSGSSVKLNWTTATETNNSGFEIERKEKSEDRSQESEWETIGFVSGFGTTTEPKSYSFADDLNLTHNLLYRLKQIDYDGSFTYSDKVEIEVNLLPKEFVLEQNYPNPFNPTTIIKFSIPKQTELKLNLYNVLGELVQTITEGLYESGNYEVTLNAENLPSGIYFYRLEGTEIFQSKKLILLK